jgi:hypothetical protein
MIYYELILFSLSHLLVLQHQVFNLQAMKVINQVVLVISLHPQLVVIMSAVDFLQLTMSVLI